MYDVKQLKQIFSESVFLYGAGKVAKTVVKYAANHNLSIEGIYVSHMEGNPTQIMEIPVQLISKEASTKKTVFVSVKENLQKDIEKIISGYEFERLYYISDKLYEILTYEIADYELEQLSQISSLKYGISSLKCKVDSLRNTIEEVRTGIRKQFFNNKVLWNQAVERVTLKENWEEDLRASSFIDKYRRLISGLDSESVETIAHILNRVDKCLTDCSEQIDLFTRKECEQLIYLQENFRDLIIKQSSDLYIFRNYYLPYCYFLPGVFVYKHGIEKVTNIPMIEGKTILDVGGFIGDSVLVLEELKPKKIITFEAVPDNVTLLYKTLELNNLENVEVVKAALGDCVGTVMMNLHGSASSYVDRGGVSYEESVEVPIMTLDHYVEENDIEDIALIKVDIEGAEMNFLRGAKETIRRFRPTLLLSIYHSAHDFFEIKPMLDEWNLGYRFSVYKPIDGSIANDTMLIAEYMGEGTQ